ncbi:NUDIX domain-containing protein [Chitinophaga sp. SYP-B3965]|uniref:NUDIX hydrolase n=1 Tax=Chitinophaga sp. SYP-B3965 TaxID=2663120 RepID=UPI0012995298|nr:NUDIX domain-containing protein [Chitinophaga sp. SYP-B3965]MRG46543.1 NUDIX domain-containing protein [Chitinophaga sp. SYP-B3965]
MPVHQHIRVTADAVVLRFNSKEGMMVLLSKRSIPPHIFKWGLPGGFVQNDEPLENAVHREIRDETGLKVNYLEQFQTFGAPNRDPRGRILCVAHVGLIKPSGAKLTLGAGNKEARWYPVRELPQMAFDHAEVIAAALDHLRLRFRHEPLAFELLDPKFPVSELEKLYEWLYDRMVDRRNFQKKIHGLGLLTTQQEKLKHPLQGRPAQLFSFNREKFSELQEKGTFIEIFS